MKNQEQGHKTMNMYENKPSDSGMNCFVLEHFKEI